ncbi:hypothetical protein CRE_21165 [Caenorhabditis remanei]|uniref:F-box domain-containing protein n=1 Tax=Caenorhabditis remanei TaxID=31234 RepID=E3MF28_CAERE|nr:hypothetical protein CRE_21165 [Caenorhabditis remanei]
MSTSPNFPLLYLPIIVLNQVLKLMTPFELIAVSLCSKTSKRLCKSIRSEIQCENAKDMFIMRYSTSTTVWLRFKYFPKIEWMFDVRKIPEEFELRKPKKNFLHKILSLFRKIEMKNEVTPTNIMNMFATDWTSGTEILPKENVTIESLNMYCSEEPLASTINPGILYLSDIFNISMDHVELHFQDFNREQNERLIDFYKQQNLRTLTLVGKRLNTPEDDKVLDYILCRQNPKLILKLALEPTSEFRFKNEYFRNQTETLEINNSQWIGMDDVLQMESLHINLYKSKIESLAMRSLIQKWVDGWIPKWRTLMIEHPENVNIDLYVDEIVSGENSNADVKSLREEAGTVNYVQHVLLRKDGHAAVVAVKDDNIGWFHVVEKVFQKDFLIDKISEDDIG